MWEQTPVSLDNDKTTFHLAFEWGFDNQVGKGKARTLHYTFFWIGTLFELNSVRPQESPSYAGTPPQPGKRKIMVQPLPPVQNEAGLTIRLSAGQGGGCNHSLRKSFGVRRSLSFAAVGSVIRRLYRSCNTPSLVTQVSDNVTNLRSLCPDCIYLTGYRYLVM